MSWKDKKVTLGFIAGIIVSAYPVWSWLDANVFFTPAQASNLRTELTDSINQKELRRAREQIAYFEGLAIEAKYRSDLSPQQKEELIASHLRSVAFWKQVEACLLADKLDC